MMKRILVVIVFAASASTAAAADSTTAETITKLETRRAEALVRADRQVLDELLTEDLTYAHASGAVENKSGLFAAFASGRLKYKKFDETNLRVRVYGDSAVVTGKATIVADTPTRGEVEVRVFFTGVYEKQPDGAWRMVAWQSTRIPD